MITQKTIDRIKQEEGLRLKPYKCPAGKLTIGYGRNIEDYGINETEALLMLENDLDNCEEQLEKYAWYNNLDGVRQGVIVDMCYNMGINKLLGFKKMIKALKNKDYKTASIEMWDSNWAKQVKTRANNLCKIMKSGKYI